LAGISCGIELSAAAVVIAKIYDEKLRASMLLLTDSFYSMAGVFSTTLAGMFLARQFHWSSAYLLAFIVALGIATIALLSRYPESGRAVAKTAPDAGAQRWPLSVHFIGLSMLVYLIAFVMIYSWVPNYAQQALGLSVETSSEIVSRFFLGLFVGQLCMFVLVLKFPVPALVVVCASAATLLTASVWMVQSGAQLQLAMFGLGLATGGLFKTLLSYGTTAVSEPSPKMVSYLIFHAGLGTAIAPFVGSLIVDQFSIVAALQFVTIAYVLTLGLILVALRQRRR
jgi:TsgA-like MFS transporter